MNQSFRSHLCSLLGRFTSSAVPFSWSSLHISRNLFTKVPAYHYCCSSILAALISSIPHKSFVWQLQVWSRFEVQSLSVPYFWNSKLQSFAFHKLSSKYYGWPRKDLASIICAQSKCSIIVKLKIVLHIWVCRKWILAPFLFNARFQLHVEIGKHRQAIVVRVLHCSQRNIEKSRRHSRDIFPAITGLFVIGSHSRWVLFWRHWV